MPSRLSLGFISFSGDPVKKSRQNTENKQTFDLSGKIDIEEKTRQNAENKQTFDLIFSKLIMIFQIVSLLVNIFQRGNQGYMILRHILHILDYHMPFTYHILILFICVQISPD